VIEGEGKKKKLDITNQLDTPKKKVCCRVRRKAKQCFKREKEFTDARGRGRKHGRQKSLRD